MIPCSKLDQTTEYETQRKLQAEKDGKTIYDVDPNLLATAFNGVELEFKDDLDEARRY
jgi:argininosuccinate synthase